MTKDESNNAVIKKNAKTVRWLVLIVFGMFAFAFAQIQLYGLFCKAVGVNSLSSRQKIDDYNAIPSRNNDLSVATADASTAHPPKDSHSSKTSDDNRVITVRFDATVNENLPWSFVPVDRKITLHPGELKRITYKVKNLTNEVITGQSIANVSPWQATPFLSKLECFCHTKQTLLPGEEKEMPLLFTLSEDLPQSMGALVVSYTFLNAEKESAKKYQKNYKLYGNKNFDPD